MNSSIRYQAMALAGLIVTVIALGAGFLLARSPNARAAMHQVGILAAPAQQEIGAFSVQISNTVNYQGLLRDENGSPLTGNYTITVKAYETGDTNFTSAEWEDTFLNVPVRNGHFRVVLGRQNALGDLFENTPLFFGVSVAGINGGAEFTPRQQVRQVPLATFASEVEDADSAGRATQAAYTQKAAKADYSEMADYIETMTRTVYLADASLSLFPLETDVASYRMNSLGTMCMLTAVQVQFDLIAPSCVFNTSTDKLVAGIFNKCELTCFTFAD